MTEPNIKYRGRTKWTEGAKVMFKCLVAKESMKYWELTENKSRVKDKYVIYEARACAGTVGY